MRGKKRPSKWIVLLIIFGMIWLAHEVRFWVPIRIIPPTGYDPAVVEMKTTSYCHCRKCCSYRWMLFIPYQKKGVFGFRFKHVGKTSSGAMVRPGTIAADTSIYPYGTIMHIPGYGYGRVADTGGAVKGRHIDLYRPNHWWARQWGVRTKKVTVWRPPHAQPWFFDPHEVGARVPAVAETNSPADLTNRWSVMDALETNIPPEEMKFTTNTAPPEHECAP